MEKKAEKARNVRMNALNDTPLPAEPEAKRAVGSFVAEMIFSVFLIAAICALRTVQIFASNVGLVAFSDLGTSMWIYMGASVAVFAVLRVFVRKPYYAGAFVAVAAFLAVNFTWLVDFLRLFVQTLNPALIGALILYVVLVTGVFFLLRLLYKKKFPLHIVTKILSLTFTGLVLFNAVLAFIASGKTASLDDAADAAVPAAAVAFSSQTIPVPVNEASVAKDGIATEPASFGLPNVYFFILDEYGTFDIMSKYYGYDNEVFYDFLDIAGFNVSRESYSTDNQTAHAFADLLNLDYISRKLSKTKCMEAISEAPLFSIFSELGYAQFQIADSKYFEGIESLSSGRGGSAYEKVVNMFGDDEADEIVSDNSISGALSDLLGSQAVSSGTAVDTKALNQWGFYPSDYIRESREYKRHKLSDYADALLSKFEFFEDPDSYIHTAPRVIYAYMLATHVPFVFNEYGGIIPYGECRNWENTDIYLNQYKFINKHLMVSLSAIIENDPDSIIIIMSDHGIRYHADCKKKHIFYITDKDSCRIMNAVYIKGHKYDIEGLSGINTLRFILSLYEGLDFPPIEDPITSDSPDSLRGIIPKPR